VSLLARLDRWARDRATALILASPERLRLRFLPEWVAFRREELARPIRVPEGEVRLLVGPANYAGQGYAWARSAERLPGVGARNLELIRSDIYGFARDEGVAEHVATLSRIWSRGQRRAVRRYTHVLVEAERPLLGVGFGGDIVAEHAALRAWGLRVAYVSHGSDLRLPSRHAALGAHSPFRDEDWDILPVLEAQALANARALRRIGAPVFVPTPELLLDVPEAVWLPIVVDTASWASDRVPLAGARPIVLHSPTNARIKGSHTVDAVAERLAAEGLIEYRRTTGLNRAQMREAVASADVVLEQFRLGIYATTAIEAMAAGRVVVGHVTEQVRSHVHASSGLALPVVEADAESLEGVLRDIAAHPEGYRATAAAGVPFVAAVHDGRFSAEVLRDFLGR
jgi:hypothetical protein